MLTQRLNPRVNESILDYGCGIGRLAKELILRTGCHVIGVDISRSMRALSQIYCESDSFFSCSKKTLKALTGQGLHVNQAFSVWVLQHTENPKEDMDFELDLRRDAKELAEHRMLVDLGRNDIGRIAEYGSVKVTDLMVVEMYSHVMHLGSQVEGNLAEELCAMDVFKACFPAGTVSGAPKVRAMEIIDELEPLARGPYAGAVGYFGWGSLSMDLAITIRTVLVSEGKAFVQAGAGIVADSEPRREFDETVNKARALLRAVSMLENSED